MEALTTHFWLFVLIVWVVASIKGRRNAQSQVDSGQLSEQEANRFFRWLLLCIALPCLFLWAIGAPPASTHPLGLDFLLPYSNAIFMGISLGLNLALATWIWLGKGDETLVRFVPCYRILPKPLNRAFVYRALSMVLSIQAVAMAAGLWPPQAALPY